VAAPGRHPLVAHVLRGLRRLDDAPPRRVKALREHHIQAMVQVCMQKQSLLGLRDAAVIALGFAGALRRSEICNLRVDDVEVVDAPSDWLTRARASGMLIHIRRSKTDPHGRGQKIAVIDGRAIRPLQRVADWLDAAGLRAAPGASYLFQSMRRGGALTGRPLHPTDVPRIVKCCAARIGLDARDIAGTRCAPASSPARPRTTPASTKSWRSRATAKSPRCYTTSATPMRSASTRARIFYKP